LADVRNKSQRMKKEETINKESKEGKERKKRRRKQRIAKYKVYTHIK
jgi:hypothetical protein